MNNLIPRQNIPHPKTLNIEPPTYTVPDVTLMFDSDDSLIWKAGENNVFIKEQRSDKLQPRIFSQINQPRIGSPINQPRTGFQISQPKTSFQINQPRTGSQINCRKDDVPIHDKENFVYNKEKPRKDPNIYAEPFKPSNKVFPVSNKVVYNPQLYASPKSVQTDSITLADSQPQIVSHDKQNHDRGLEGYSPSIGIPLRSNPSSNKEIETKCAKNPELPHISDISLIPEYYKRTQKPLGRRVDFYSSDSKSPPYHSPKGEVGLNSDSYILKLIEGQSEQISYLHKVLEKVLDKSTNEGHGIVKEEKHCKHCLCNNPKSDQKIAIVQTSFSDAKPETKSVSTNTDVSWNNILLSFPNKENQNGRDRATPMSNRTNKVKQYYDTPKESSFPMKRDVSLTLKGIEMETVCDPVSPEQSLHINVPAFQDDQCPIDHYSPTTKNYNSVQGKTESEFNTQESPLVGESAMHYNERHKQEQNQVMMQRVVEETSQEDSNGLTLYNNVMISIKQILQKTNANENEETSVLERKDYDKRDNEITVTPQRKRPPTNQLQMQRVSTVFDTLYVPSHSQGLTHSELEIVDRPLWERPTVPSNRITDAQLLAIAQRSPGGIRGSPNIHENNIAQPSYKYASKVDKHESDFSFATRQFLGKYELDK